MMPKQLQQERGIGNYSRKQQIDRVSCPEQEAQTRRNSSHFSILRLAIDDLLTVLESSRVFPLPKALTQLRMNPPSHKPCLQEVTAKMKTGSAVRSTRTDMSSCRESWGNSQKERKLEHKQKRIIRNCFVNLALRSALKAAWWQPVSNMEEWEKIFISCLTCLTCRLPLASSDILGSASRKKHRALSLPGNRSDDLLQRWSCLSFSR